MGLYQLTTSSFSTVAKRKFLLWTLNSLSLRYSNVIHTVRNRRRPMLSEKLIFEKLGTQTSTQHFPMLFVGQRSVTYHLCSLFLGSSSLLISGIILPQSRVWFSERVVYRNTFTLERKLLFEKRFLLTAYSYWHQKQGRRRVD